MTTTEQTMGDQLAKEFPDLRYSAEFVPWSKSRNAGEKQPSLNWRIRIDYKGQHLVTDYTQGIGHVPGWRQGDRTAEYDAYCKNVAECGKTYPFRSASLLKRPLPEPPLPDVLHSLVMDSDVLDHVEYESWATDCGYDPDSRAGEAVYRACLKIALTMRNMFGEAGLARLRVIFQDY